MNLRGLSALSSQSRRCRVTAGIANQSSFCCKILMKRKSSDLVGTPQHKRRKMETTRIELTPRETQLRNLLLDAARYIEESKDIKNAIELRWAGGWVRDKLLDLQSHDIDVAISTMTGHDFCEEMRKYLRDGNNMKKHSLTAKDVGGLHKILANPDKSKHLETANTRIYDFDLDFVNLRKETYSEDSRNPQMEFGTAEEDALRRDATINALFYNLHTNLVEDFTGGLEDMAIKRIRTPLEPYTTFKDDPLRVLRLIRFASRLGFTIDQASEKSMSDPSVLEALKLKISRERVGVELEKMLKGNDPAKALQLIDRLGLYSTIFTDPTAQSPPPPDSTKWHVIYESLEVLESDKAPGSIYQSLVRSDDAKYLAWIFAALTPWSTIPNPQPATDGGKLPLPLATNVTREGFKGDNKTCSAVTAAFRNLSDIIKLKVSVGHNEAFVEERDTLGMMIRKWDSIGGQWKLQVLFSLLVDVSRSGEETFDRDAVFSDWQKLIDHLESLNLMDVIAIRNIVDGKRLQTDLNASPGPWLKEALEICMAWQLRNPELVEKNLEKAKCEAVEEVKRRRIELKIPTKKN